MARPVLERYAGNSASTTLSSAVSDTDTAFPLTSDTTFGTNGGMIIIDEGTATEEYAYYTGKTGASLDCALVNRGLEGGSAQAHAAGATVKGVLTAGSMENIYTSLASLHNATTGLFDTTKAYKIFAALSLPEGTIINGKIIPSVASNNLTVALKGMDGNDPSATNPVYVRIGSAIKTITAALSVTKAAGTNWCNAGGAALATKETDYFVYMGYNATDGTVIGFSRIPYATLYSEFSATAANEKYCGISTITTAAAGDNYVNVGRFAATLSAGAGYTWTVPTFTATNLIQRPVYESRWLTWVSTPTWTGGAAPTTLTNSTYKYMIRGKELSARVGFIYSTAGTTITKVTFTTPFTVLATDYTFYPAALSNVFAPLDNMMQVGNGATTYDVYCDSSTVDRGGFNITHEI